MPAGLFQTKPDILIRRGGTVTHVIDTKWKRISSRIDDPKQGVSQADVYQMMAYAQLYLAPRLGSGPIDFGQLS
ncbi:MAG: 5-methylcytosine restriction system specificity protein McrC [Sagittula sp.]|uniref:5-methylcytosine restriction system specificity protein McrC n=1 Tax=Sagittula sp. TaxID=2038081 RepID=UPI004059CB5A